MTIRVIAVDDICVVICMKFDYRASATDVQLFKTLLCKLAEFKHSIESTGTFDFMVELAFTDFGSYTDRMKTLADPIATLVERYETSFVGKRFVPAKSEPDALWIPYRDGLQRIRCSDIDVIRAEGDYIRIQAGARDWLMNITMTSILERLETDHFLQIHRSTIVRREFIDRLSCASGRWTAHLIDGTAERIAKTQAGRVVRALKGDPPTSAANDAANDHSAEAGSQLIEIASAG